MSKQTINEELENLEEITRKLEEPELDLEDSIKLYKEGMELVEKLGKRIEEAQLTIMKLTPEAAPVEIALEDEEF